MTPWDVQSKRVYGPDGVAPTLQSGTSEGMSIQPVVCVQGTVAAGKRMGQNGLGASDDGACYTLDTVDAHAVAYAQNQRYEVREEGGDGSICGALPANSSGKQLQFVAYAVPSNAVGAPNSGTNGAMAVGEMRPTLKSDGKSHAVCYSLTPGISTTAKGDGFYDNVSPSLRAVSNSNTPAVCYAPAVICMADDNAKSAVDADLAGTLKVGGGHPFVAYRATGGASSAPSAQGTTRVSGASTSGRGR